MDELRVQINVARSFEDFNDFEGYILQEVRRLILEQMRCYLEELDKRLSDRFKKGHKGYVCHGFSRRKLRCYFGKVLVKRRRYRCRGRGDVYPLDEFLPEGGMSRICEELALDLATEIPYRRSSRLLRQFTGSTVSGMGIWHRLQRRGRSEREDMEKERLRIFEQARDEYPQDYRPLDREDRDKPFYVEIDGTFVSSRQENEDRFEIKTGVMYSEVETVGKRRKRLLDKFVYSSVEDSVRFGQLFYGVCRKNGLDHRRRIDYLSDGAGWLRAICKDVFPQANKRLDLYHLKKACCKVITDEEWEDLQRVLYEGDTQTFIDTLESIVSTKNLTPQEKTELLTYVMDNRDSLNYGRNKRNGSGAVEKNIGIYVGRRFKRQGMSWSREGANNLVALRTKKLNRLWHNKIGSLT